MSESAATPITIRHLDAIDCRFEPRPWAFAQSRADEIAAHWARLTSANPALFNGKVLLLHTCILVGDTLKGAYLETDYAGFLAWRDFGNPGEPMWNCFAMAALRGCDGAFLLGEMAPHTANPGKIHFAAGTPDRSDIIGDRVDLEGSVLRELGEETGIAASEVTLAAGWTAVLAGPRIALMRIAQSARSSRDLKLQIETWLKADPQAELAGVHIISELPDSREPRMPPFQIAYLRHMFGQDALSGPDSHAGSGMP